MKTKLESKASREKKGGLKCQHCIGEHMMSAKSSRRSCREAEREPNAGQDPDRMAGRDCRGEVDAEKAFQRLPGRACMPALHEGKRAEHKNQQMKQHRSRTCAKSEARSRLHGRT